MIELGREKIRRLFIPIPTRSNTSRTYHHTTRRRTRSATSITTIESCWWQRTRSCHLISTQQEGIFSNNYTNSTPLESCFLGRYFSTKENATRTQINSALRRLSLKQGFSVLELRDAYFEAAKKCHPDANQDDDEVKARSSDLFLKVTEAYELLRKYPRGDISSSSEIDEDEYYEKNIISKTEEQFYRDAVYETLGMRAEDLEESKKCPLFRIWLAGGSHTAFHFNLFLMRHGGLAPMLGKKKTTALIGEGKRRRRKR